MSRLQPYRNRIPVHIIKLLDVSSRITLFLVGQNGPLSFIFKDRLQNKYKTSIGAQIKCTCSHSKNDHCIHSLYVLLKIFKISVQNPIMWQCSYIDSQLSDIVGGKHTVVPVRQRINRPNFNFDSQISSQILPSDFYFRKQVKARSSSVYDKVEAMTLEQDSVCPICQQGMKKGMNLTYCKVSCGNNYHLQCLKVWVSHKKNQESKITCPMCRQQFRPSMLEELKQQEIEWKKKQVTKNSHRYKCSNCGLDQILKNAHKCILCEKFQLCQACYMGNKHIKHPFAKCNQMGEWEPADQRRPGELKIKEFIDKKRKQSKNNQILQKLRQKKSSSCLIDYICSSYPYVSKYISENIDPYKKLNMEPQTMQCQKCGSKRMIFLRRLTCGHFIDHDCLKQNIRKGIMYCEKDGDKILKGYEDLLKKQSEIKYQEEKVELEVGCEFRDANMQRLLSQDDQGNEPGNIMTSREYINNRGQQNVHNQISRNFRRNVNAAQRQIINGLNQRQLTNEIRKSNALSRDRGNKKSKSTLPLNLMLANNPNSHQFIVRQPQIKTTQKYSGLQRTPQRAEEQHNYDQRTMNIGRMQVINKRLPSLSRQHQKSTNRKNIISQSNQPLAGGRLSDQPFNFNGIFRSSTNGMAS